MKSLYIIVLISQVVLSEDHLWHSHHFSSDHQSREELIITNVTADENLKFPYKVWKWKSVEVDGNTYLAGLTPNSVVFTTIKYNVEPQRYQEESHSIELSFPPTEIALFRYWNRTTHNKDVIAVIGTEKPELLWFRFEGNQSHNFWTWTTTKQIQHLNVFRLGFNDELFIIQQHLTHITADLYRFDLSKPNFWLHQTIPLSENASTSACISVDKDYFLAIPQTNKNSLLIYQFINNHFKLYENLSSNEVSEVVSFNIGNKAFLAANGLDAAIYHFRKSSFVKAPIKHSNFDGINFWLTIPVNTHRDETLLVAQRFLNHGDHTAFEIEFITYDGQTFEEHEDIPCFYFGEQTRASFCLPGDQLKGGIVGGTPIYLDDTLGMIIPRRNHSELFFIETELMKHPNPLNNHIAELTKMRQHLEAVMEEQEKKLENLNSDPLEEIKSDLKKLDEKMDLILANEELGNYETVTFNGDLEIKGIIVKEVSSEMLEGKPTNAFLEDIVIKNNVTSPLSSKMFANLITENLGVDSINGIDSSDLLFNTDEIIRFKNDLILQEPLIVANNVNATIINGKHFESEIVQVNQPFEEELFFSEIEVIGDLSVKKFNNFPLSKRSVPEDDAVAILEGALLDTLLIPNSIKVNNINGENFDGFLEELCMKNIKTFVPQTVKVTGNVHVQENANIEHLNELKFPSEYIFASDRNSINITGLKRFDNGLVARQIHGDGTVNGIQLTKVITLSNQNVTGRVIFENLEIAESLEVDGEVIGEQPNMFLPNPTIINTDVIKANVHFKHLEVEGSVIIGDKFNGHNFRNFLSDIVYKDEQEAIIESRKEFPKHLTVFNDLEIKSNSVNHIKLDSIVTKNTDQILNISAMNGNTNFGTIQIEGTFDEINVTKLDQESVKLTGQQFIPATLIFEDDVHVNNLDIIEEINHQNFEEFSRENDPEFQKTITVDHVVVEGNLIGSIHDFDLEDYQRRRLSLSTDQNIEIDYELDEVEIDTVEPIQINGINWNDLSYEAIQRKIKTKLLEGTLQIENLFVNNSLNVLKLNNEDAMYIGGSLFKQKNPPNLIFQDDVYFDSIEIEKLSGVNFGTYIENIVFKNETDVELAGDKTFLKGFTVDRLIETKQINDIPINQILTKFGDQQIQGDVIIHGDVTFAENINVSGRINDIDMKLLTENYEINDNTCTIKGDMIFARMAHINNLTINGNVNNGEQCQDALDGLLYKNSDLKLSGITIFENKVNIDGNLRVVDTINDINWPEFVSNIVITTKDTKISSAITFTEPLEIEGEFTVKNKVTTPTISNINPEEWMKEAVFINKALLPGTFIFEKVQIEGNLQSEFINDLNMSTIIPLKEAQNLNDLSFGQVTTTNDIVVKNSTNFRNLTELYENTFFMDSDQIIYSEIEFNDHVVIEGDTELWGTLNEMDLQKIVTVNTEQELFAVYKFSGKTTIESDLIVTELMNGINLTDWVNNGVKLSSKIPQEIHYNWVIEKDLVFEDHVQGNALINGIDFQKFSNELEEKRNYKYKMERVAIDTYREICKDLTFMYHEMQTQIYKFDYLENLQKIHFLHRVNSVHHFKFNEKFYVLISEENQCESHLFVLDSTHFKFVTDLILGEISQIISVKGDGEFYFVTQNYGRFCNIEGTNIWQISDNLIITHLLNIDPQFTLQDSLVPNTFYGISGHTTVTEYQIKSGYLRKYRKWVIEDEYNLEFVPRGLGTGLALTSGTKLIRLHQTEPIIEEAESNYDTEVIIRGNISIVENPYFPTSKQGDYTVLKVGKKNSKRSFLAMAIYEEMSIMGGVDTSIKIYENMFTGQLFHKLPTNRPTSLVNLEFHNGESLLAFMENENILQVYEYKGIEGFKHRMSTKLQASKLFVMSLPLQPYLNQRQVLGVIHENSVAFIEANMLGNQLEEDLQCSL